MFMQDRQQNTNYAMSFVILKSTNAAEKPVVSYFPNLAPRSLNSTVLTSYSSTNIFLLAISSKNLEKNMIYTFIIKGPPSLGKYKGKYDNAQADNKTNFGGNKLPP